MRAETELLKLTAGDGFVAMCRVERIDLADGRAVVIFEQLDSDPDQAHALRVLVPQVSTSAGIDVRNSIWVEYVRLSAAGDERSPPSGAR